MGSGSSRASRASQFRTATTNPVTRVTIRETSVQTSTLNLRAQASEVSHSAGKSIKQDVSVQTSTLNLRAIEQKTNEKQLKLLPEIKLVPNRTRTLIEDDDHTRQELITNIKYRQYMDNNCYDVRSIAELVQKVKSYTENDLVRAWLIFYWITKNIKYVTSHADNAADVVFQKRTGVCRGFTHLFSECCRLMNIECVEVPGFVKENWFRIGDALQQATHVWNAVKLSNYWYLLDATWGAGSGNEKKIEEFYFLTSPDQMIYTHLPTEDLWQLLSPSITKQQFLDLPLVKSTYYRLNLKLISPKQCVIETNQSLFEVIIKTPSPDITLTTTMKVGGDEYPDFHQLCQYDNTTGMTRCYFSPTNDAHRLFPTQVTSTENERTFPDVHLAIIEQRSFLDLNIKRHS
ncbi:unnamed protein product [Rotaria sordida]|uniref:Transglutaminase-like domain-containing protein n=1 Tax=Rotaria sordida TaxID=392033 RepID=A0A814NQL4_9BILA|nr:unnamed protein product [Rotaria sordida]